jgi:GntR family transcriptional repressor for pyruvate dehydrogenase complex
MMSDMAAGAPAKAGNRPAQRRNLVAMVSEKLRQAILDGELRPGEKLPSEAALTQQYKVSRTVIREAIASLRADGLLEPRHGVGVFVLNSQQGPFQAFQSAETARISSIIEMLELRAAVEIEAAGLAATRRSPAQEEAILECCDDLDQLITEGRPTTEADFAFHLAVADATNNPRFRDFLERLGRNVIPRASLQAGQQEDASNDYLEQIQAEHRRIAKAISARDEEGARQAMRIHLKDSQQRYRNLIRRA